MFSNMTTMMMMVSITMECRLYSVNGFSLVGGPCPTQGWLYNRSRFGVVQIVCLITIKNRYGDHDCYNGDDTFPKGRILFCKFHPIHVVDMASHLLRSLRGSIANLNVVKELNFKQFENFALLPFGSSSGRTIA